MLWNRWSFGKERKSREILIYRLNTNSILSDNKENVNYIGPSYTSINSIKTDSEISFLYLSPDNKYLFAGFFNGLIEIFAITDSKTAISTQVILSLIKIQISQIIIDYLI